MADKQYSLGNTLWRVVLPIAIGGVVIAWMFHDEFSMASWRQMRFGTRQWLGITLALIFVVGRDFGLAWRFHTIAAPDLSWARAIKTDLMCAFTSAITPSAVGGSALAIFYLNQEGIKVGRATTLTLTTLFLDEMFFVVFCPLVMLLIPFDDLFGGTQRGAFLTGIEITFWIVYAGIVVWTAILFTGILLRPALVRDIAMRLFALRGLRRWRHKIEQMTDNMLVTSSWVKRQPLAWWLRVFGATTLSWFSRYLVVNALFWAFVPAASPILVFGRQFVVWVVLMVSPTPGSSGISEWMFTEYYGDIIGSVDLALVMALIWRLTTYYIYLAAGTVLLPSYFKKRKHETSDDESSAGSLCADVDSDSCG